MNKVTQTMLMRYQSYGYCTKNESGFEAVDVHYHQTFWQWLTRKPATKEVWEFRHVGWVEKTTGKLADYDKSDELEAVRAEVIKIDREWAALRNRWRC